MEWNNAQEFFCFIKTIVFQYIAHKGDEPLFSRSSSTTDSSLQVQVSGIIMTLMMMMMILMMILIMILIMMTQVSKPASISASRRWCCCIGNSITNTSITNTAANLFK